MKQLKVEATDNFRPFNYIQKFDSLDAINNAFKIKVGIVDYSEGAGVNLITDYDQAVQGSLLVNTSKAIRNDLLVNIPIVNGVLVQCNRVKFESDQQASFFNFNISVFSDKGAFILRPNTARTHFEINHPYLEDRTTTLTSLPFNNFEEQNLSFLFEDNSLVFLYSGKVKAVIKGIEQPTRYEGIAFELENDNQDAKYCNIFCESISVNTLTNSAFNTLPDVPTIVKSLSSIEGDGFIRKVGDSLESVSITRSQASTSELVRLKKSVQDILNNVGTKQIKWMAFGDSMAMTKTKYVFSHLDLFVGRAGAVNFGNYRGISINGGAITTIQDYTVFPFSFSQIDTGNFLSLGIDGITSKWNAGKIYLLNNGATYTVKINGIAVAGQTNVVLANNNAVTIVNLSPSIGLNTLNIHAVLGNVKVLSSAILNTTVSGIVPCYFAEGGNDMSSWIGNAQALSNFNLIVSDINPDVISYDMKEIVLGFDARLELLLTNLQIDAPKAELILFTQTPTALTNNDMIANNAIIRKKTEERQIALFDCYKYFIDYTTLFELGWGGDGVHPSDYAHQFLSFEFLKEFSLLSFHDSNGSITSNSRTVSKTYESGVTKERQMRMFIDPIFGLDAQIKAPRFLELGNLNGTTLFRIDLDNGTNGSDGTQTMLPFLVRFGNNGARVRGDLGALYVLDTTNGANPDDNLGAIVVKDIEYRNSFMRGHNISTYGSNGHCVSRIYHLTGNVVYGNENLGAFSDIESAMIQIQSTTKGFLMPRMTTVQRNAIVSPAEGLEIYNLTVHAKEFFNGTIWKTLVSM